MDQYIFIIYGLFLLGGAYFGWKKGSKISLITGGVSGLLVLAGVGILHANPKGAFLYLAGISGFLAVTFFIRFLKTNKFMPSGLLLMTSLTVLAISIARWIQQS